MHKESHIQPEQTEEAVAEQLTTETSKPAEKESLEDGLKAEIQELKDQLLRALAEVENVRKRAQVEREQTHKFAVSSFAKDLLQVADTMEQALAVFDPAALESNELLRKVVEGIRLTQQELQRVFERYQIKRIYPMGEKFDPHFHQAMFEQPSEGDAGMVVSVLQPGYILHDRLLRPAMVGVSKKG